MVRYDYDRFDYTDRFAMDRRDQERLERMIDDARRELDRDMRGEDPILRVVNDPTIVLSAKEKAAINNPKIVMTPDRRLVKAGSAAAASTIGGRSPLYPPITPTKRTRKKTKMDKTMSRCLKQANKQMRKKNGQLRKGKTMADVMRLAHRLCKRS